MFEIQFYRDKNGDSEILNYINDLKERARTSKDSEVNYNKIIAYMDMLKEMGTRVGDPVTKHLDGEIWELRPLRNRLLYAYYKDNIFIILHSFIKKTRKTPRREINKAKRNLKDFLERSE